MPGEIDGDEGPIERHGDGVPCVGVLGPAVDQDELGGRGPPQQAAHLASRRDLDLDPPYGRRSGIGEAELGCVLREEAELVVGRHVLHSNRTSCPPDDPSEALRMAVWNNVGFPPWCSLPERASACTRSGRNPCISCVAGP